MELMMLFVAEFIARNYFRASTLRRRSDLPGLG